MSRFLVVAETRRGELRDVSLEAIEAARRLARDAGHRLSVAVLDSEPERFEAAVDLEGVDEVVSVRLPAEHFEPHLMQRAVEGLVDDVAPSLVVAAHTLDALGWAPAVAASRGLGFAGDVIDVSWRDGPLAIRGAYDHKLTAELDFPRREVVLLLLRAGANPRAAGAGNARRRALAADLSGAPIAEHVEFIDAERSGVDVAKAGFLLAVGRGVGGRDGLAELEALAETIGATLAVSRPLVDAGWVSSARLVGQSGKSVKPKVYLALGISGAVQHVAGIQDAETIIAVNSDAEAPIFGVADYGVVADLFDVVEQLKQHF